MANGMFWSTSNGDGMGENTASVKIPPSPLVACSVGSYLYIPVSYFALLKQQKKNIKILALLVHVVEF